MPTEFECTPACNYCGAKAWNAEAQAEVCDVKGAIFSYDRTKHTFLPNTGCPKGLERGGAHNLSPGSQPGGSHPATAAEILSFLRSKNK
ncbi:MAG: hypothetical protein WCO78_03600 [Candidatus Roizmanbacteria bacterium]